MLVSNMMIISRLFIYIMSIVLLIPKKGRNVSELEKNRLVKVIFIIYINILAFLAPSWFDLNFGLEILFTMGLAIIDTIILVIGIICVNSRIRKEEKRLETDSKENNKNKEEKKEKKTNKLYKKHYSIIVIFIPVVLILAAFLREIILINNCKMIITYNYQNGIIESTDTKYAIGENYCKVISIGKKFIIKKWHEENSAQCYVTKDEQNNLDIKTYYSDVEFDKDIIEKIFEDKSYKGSSEVEKNDAEEHSAYVDRILNTDYYIISHSIKSMGVVGKAIYLTDRFIDDIHGYGNIDSVIVFEK